MSKLPLEYLMNQYENILEARGKLGVVKTNQLLQLIHVVLKQHQPTQDEKDFVRHAYVRDARREGVTWEQAYALASERLATERGFSGGVDTMKKSYARYERSLRPRCRRLG